MLDFLKEKIIKNQMEPAEDSAGSVETKKGISTANPSYVSGGFPPCLCIYHIMFFIYCKFLPNKKTVATGSSFKVKSNLFHIVKHLSLYLKSCMIRIAPEPSDDFVIVKFRCNKTYIASKKQLSFYD